MGFSPLWSRPDWMICQVLPIAPPYVRPSVKHNAMLNKDDTMKKDDNYSSDVEFEWMDE